MERDPERYSLASEQLRKIYEKRVAPRLFRGAAPSPEPTAIVLGGQPGAGKTPLQNDAAAEFADRGGLVKIIGDDLRAYLPHYSALQRADDKTAAFYTDRDSGRLVEMAIADAVERRVNVLVEGTMRNPEVVAKTLRDFRAAGFRTAARALAVSPELSSLGILQRYAAQKESRGVGRMTTSEAHQAAVTGMLATLDRIQDKRLADRLTIYRRGGETIARFDWTVPSNRSEPRARKLVERERLRALTPEEARYKQSEIERLTPILQKHGIIPAQDRTPDHSGHRLGPAAQPRGDDDRELRRFGRRHALGVSRFSQDARHRVLRHGAKRRDLNPARPSIFRGARNALAK